MEEEDAGARRSSKRMRITEGWDVHRAGQRVSLAPPLPPAEEERKAKEREAVKRELDAARARRRSSRGRPSIGAPPGTFFVVLPCCVESELTRRCYVAAKAKSRFGFLGAAKSLVRNVWNMGGGSKAKSAAATVNPPPSSIPVASCCQPARVPGAVWTPAHKSYSKQRRRQINQGSKHCGTHRHKSSPTAGPQTKINR